MVVVDVQNIKDIFMAFVPLLFMIIIVGLFVRIGSGMMKRNR